MRLGKKVKLNMMIAILLCMAFVVNIGVTLAVAEYTFRAGSVHNATKVGETTTINYDNYIDFASAQGSSGKFIYSPGTYNNQLSINYGFRQEHDLMIEFTAKYLNESHKANDFSINFVDRDNWVIDMGTTDDWITGGDDQTYYNLTSSSNIISGAMYYMGTKSGSATMPIISSVTFHTSPNNAYSTYTGDTLEITITPKYVKSNANNYDTYHKFYSNDNDTVAFNNWATYMDTKGSGKTSSTASFMIYNAYVDYDRAISYPYDLSVLDKDGEGNVTTGDVDPELMTQPTYSNTAYKYKIEKTTVGETITTKRTYNAITAGNKYNGGLGVYVIPHSSTLTMSITINPFWCKEDVSLDTTQSGNVFLGYSNEIHSFVNGTTYHYYKAKITKPTYVNVLDYIRLTAETYTNFVLNDYRLILNNITVQLVDSTNLVSADTSIENNTSWDANTTVPTYDIHNSTTSSPILARVKDVAVGPATYDANISITNNDDKPLVINGFAISSELWYGLYSQETVNGKTISMFNKTPMGTGYLTEGSLIYDTTMWKAPTCINGVFTFESKSSGTIYIPSGYTITLISGVIVPTTETCQTYDEEKKVGEANDFWCSLEVVAGSVNVASGSENVNYERGTTTGVEVITKGYYDVITSSNPGYIYIRNNTSQIITGITLSGLSVLEVDTVSDFLPRDSTGNDAEYTLTQHLTGTISIKPNEMVLAYTITPINGVDEDGEPVIVKAIINDFTVNASLVTSQESDEIDLVYNANTSKGVLINNGTSYYEFRLKSATDISGILVNSGNDFVAHQVGNVYYYYYKGIICPNRYIEIFNGFANNVVVEKLEHASTMGVERYEYLTDGALSATKLTSVVANFADAESKVRWGITASDIVVKVEDVNEYQWFAAWLDAMCKLYNAPTSAEREEASANRVVERAKNNVFEKSEMFTIVPDGAATFEVEDGKSFTFTIQLSAGYKYGETVVVKANGTELTLDNGKYSITSVVEDIEITVQGIEEDV